MTVCPRCLGRKYLREWLVEGRVGLAYIVVGHVLHCWRCKGTGSIR